MTCPCLLLAISLLTAGSIVHSQEDERDKVMFKACRNTANLVLKKFEPSLQVHSNLRPLNDLVAIAPAADYNVFVNYRSRRVLIPISWCVQTFFMADAMVQYHFDPSLRPKLDRYISYLDRRQAKVAKNPIDNEGFKSFSHFGRIGAPSLTQEEAAKRHNLIEDFMVEAMAFVLGHEIGHLVLNHVNHMEVAPARSREQEDEADAFAVKLVKGADMMILPAMLSLNRFMLAEAHYSGSDPSRRTHPRAECRLEKVVYSSGELDMLFRIPNLRADFERRSGYSVSEFRNLMRQLRRDCKNSP